MTHRIVEVKTNLYDLISMLHDEVDINDGQIPELVKSMAKSGKIRWARNRELDVHKQLELENRI